MEHEVKVNQQVKPNTLPQQNNSLGSTLLEMTDILNNSDYEDDTDEIFALRRREHETDTESEYTSSDEEEELEDQTEVGKSTGGPSKWQRKSFTQTKPSLQEPSYLPDTCSSPKNVLDYFNEYFDDTLLDIIVQKTNQTAMQQGKPLNFTRAECKIYFGIVITMSCFNYPDIQMYWSEDKWAIELITKAMSCDRFMTLRNSLKLVFDDEITQEMRASDNLWKVRPIINRFLEACHQHERMQNMAIDQMIIPLKGSGPIAQYGPDESKPLCIEIAVLLNPNGLICDFVICQGKDYLDDEIALQLTKTLVPGHILYLNEYVTTINLVEQLNHSGFKCVGALMKSDLPKELKSKLQSSKTLSEKQESYDVLVSSNGEMAVTKWFNNKPLLFLSTVYAAETVKKFKCYDRQTGRKVYLTKPEVAQQYQSNTGGVGIFERVVASCHSDAKFNKWTIKFIHHFIDFALSNSWIKYINDMQKLKVPDRKISHLWKFRSHIGKQLIESNLIGSETAKRRERLPLAPVPSNKKRTRKVEHLPIWGTEQHCRNTGCNKKSSVICETCQYHLCVTPERNCFLQFHTKLLRH